MLCIKRIILILGLLMIIPLVSAATPFWVIDPNSCPSNNQTEFPGDFCEPDDICGELSDVPQCFDTSTMVAPSANTTTYSNNNLPSENDGGSATDCFAAGDGSAPHCDNGGAYTCERNETFHGSPVNRNTVCLGTGSGGGFGETRVGFCKTEGTDMFDCFGDTNCESSATSDCDSSANNHYTTATCNTGNEGGAAGTCVCDTNRFACDGSITDGDGCEIAATVACGAGTGTVQLDECFSGTQGNCTRISDFLDCDNDDSDNTNLTCNFVGNGCEVNPGTTTNNSNSEYQSCTTFECVGAGTLNGWLDCDSGAADPDGGNGTDANGCEIQNNSACAIGVLSGTINMCSGGSGNCVVDDQDIATTGIEVVWSGTNPMLWLTQLGSGLGTNITFLNNKSFTINSTGPYWDGTLLTGGGGGGGTDYTNLALTNESETWDPGLNITLGTGGWFFGLFNWTTVSTYLNFDGGTLIFNDSLANTNFNQTQTILDSNASWTSTFNASYDSKPQDLTNVAFRNESNTFNGNISLNGTRLEDEESGAHIRFNKGKVVIVLAR